MWCSSAAMARIANQLIQERYSLRPLALRAGCGETKEGEK